MERPLNFMWSVCARTTHAHVRYGTQHAVYIAYCVVMPLHGQSFSVSGYLAFLYSNYLLLCVYIYKKAHHTAFISALLEMNTL